MENSSSTSSSEVRPGRPPPAGGLLGLALVILFEITAASIPTYVTEPAPYFKTGLLMKGEEAAAPDDHELLVLGQCFTYDAVIPPVLEAALGWRAYNLGVNRAHLWLSEYILFDRYLDRAKHSPRLVAMEISPDALVKKKVDPLYLLEEHILPFLGPSLDLFLEAPGWSGKVAVLRYCITPPSVRKQFFLKRLDWPLRWLRYDRAKVARELALWRRDQGFLDKDRDVLSRKEFRPVHVPPALRNFDLDPLNMKFMEKCIERAAEAGIPVVLYTPAVNRERKDAWGRWRVQARCLDMMKRIKERHGNVRAVVDLFEPVLPDTVMADNYHPNREGAERFTRTLARALRPFLER